MSKFNNHLTNNNDKYHRNKLNTIGVIGAGVMGTGLTAALLETKHQVVLIDLSKDHLNQAITNIRQQIRLGIMMGRINRQTDLDGLLANVTISCDLNALENVDFVIENISESWQKKSTVYPKIDVICDNKCVFAANTSAITISKIAALTQRPDKIIGIHFMNPVEQKPVVETIRGLHTSNDTIDITQTLLSQLNKTSILVNDGPGFVSNRISHLFMNEAILVLQDQLAHAQAIDDIFTRCYSHETGPLATADLIGLDTVLNTLEVLFEQTKEHKFKPAPLLKKMVKARQLGRKTKQGFYRY
jgi:3-hydroxybutyryl-CoA dehydrogenase